MRQAKFIAYLFVFFIHVLAAEEAVPSVTIKIPMRDGTELPTDIYLPKNAEGKDLECKAPCVLMRSPTGRQAKTAKEYLYLTESGYVVVIQDTRSALDKEGRTLPYSSDGWTLHQDGFDTVEWLSKSEYTNGSIGTVGVSAMGITQMLMAPTAPAGLKCQYIRMAAASLYHDAIYPGGQLLKSQVEGWLGVAAHDPKVRNFICCQPNYSAFWSHFDTRAVADRVKSAGLHYGGWYDIFVQGTIDGFTSRQERGGEGAKGKQKLVIGPYTHSWPQSNALGDFDMPKTAYAPPVDISAKQWLDHHLKGVANNIAELPPVTYYVMGPFDGSPSSGNIWRHAESWPVPAKAIPFYLTNQMSLSEEISPIEKNFTYQHKTDDPTPTVGGRNLFLESGPKDQRLIEQRKDVIVFTTEPLTEDLEVTGRIIANLHVSSDLTDTDFAVRLTDVYPDGRSILIADGLTRMGLPPKKPGEINQVDVDLWSTSIVFTKGHRIRISITSSNYPRFEKSTHTQTVANNTIHTGSQHPSKITLPVTRRGGTEL